MPYNLRAKGLAVVVVCAYAASFFSNYVNPIGMANAGWKYYLLYNCWLVVMFVTVWFLFVETKSTVLEEVALAFDGDKALVGGGVGTLAEKELAIQQSTYGEVEMIEDSQTKV